MRPFLRFASLVGAIAVGAIAVAPAVAAAAAIPMPP